MSMQSPCVLTNEQTWPKWFHTIKSTAIKQGIWEYIDPNDDRPEPLPLKPREPQPSAYREDGTADRNLNDREQQIFDHDYQRWKRKATKIESIHKNYNDIGKQIHATIAPQYKPLIEKKDSVHDKLRSLFAKASYHRIRYLFQKWESLIKTPHPKKLHQWLEDWESFLVEARRSGQCGLVAKTTNWEPVFCFIDAVRPIESDFAESCEFDVIMNNNLTIQEVIDNFRNHLQATRGAKLSETSCATPGNPSTNQRSSNKPAKKSNQKGKGWLNTPCVCGKMHPYSKCYYVIEIIRPAAWKPKSHIESTVAGKCKDPVLLGRINKARKFAKLPEWPVQNTQHTATIQNPNVSTIARISADGDRATPEPRSSFILGSGATTHICNDFTQFFDFHHEKQWLAHGDSGSWSEGYGKVTLQMNAPTGTTKVNICLGDVAYLPKYPLNIVSFPRFFERGMHWRTDQGLLYKGGRSVARVEMHGNQFIIGQGISHSVQR